MISMEGRSSLSDTSSTMVEVVQPASPPPENHHRFCESPEIRVTDTPSPLSPPTSSHGSPRSASVNGAESPLGSPTLPNPLLFQPFLPALMRPLPFSIDNILKPTFGGNKFLAAAAAAAAAAHVNSMNSSALNGTGLTLPPNTQSPLSSLHHHHHQSSPLPPMPPRSVIKSEPNIDITNTSPPPPAIPIPQRPNPIPSTQSAAPPKSTTSQPVDLSSKQTSNSPKSSSSSSSDGSSSDKKDDCPPGMVRGPNGQLWPAWVFCTRYSDRPSSGPRARKIKKKEKGPSTCTPSAPSASSLTSSSSSLGSPGSINGGGGGNNDEKRPRTAFSSEQLNRLRREFDDNRYLNEERRKSLAMELNLNETQIKIWFQNKRAKLKKSTGGKGDLAKMLEAQGLYNHATVPVDEDGEEIFNMQ